MAELVAQVYMAAELAARRVLRAEDGQDTMEYGLVAVLISISAVFVIVLFGPELRNWYQDIVNAFP